MSSILKTNALESEAIYILESNSQFDSQYCFSGGKIHYIGSLAQKHSFLQKKFSIIACDTGHNFPETIEFRDRLVKELGLELIVRKMLLMKEK
jgi:sulfate adenylyltransferase subunit 2